MSKVLLLLLVVGLVISQPSSLPAQKKQVTDDDNYYVCPMHPDVASEAASRCSKCGMTMIKTRRPIDAEYDVQIRTTPSVVKPNEKFLLTFDITHPQSRATIKDFNIFHDMPFHLFVVSQDLDYFDHVHPKQRSDGRFVIETSVPKAGAYFIYCDIFPVGGMQHVVKKSLITSGFKADLFEERASLRPDTVLSKAISGMRVDLLLNPVFPQGGKNVILKYRLTDEKTGNPVSDLQPYLGAWGHTLILSEDGKDYVHSHPSELIPAGVNRTSLQGGPDVSFAAFLPRAGRYRIWSQFQRNNEVITVSFAIAAKGY